MSNYKKTPTIYQMEATECGAASLSMIFAYFGRQMALEQMRIETGVSRDGCNAGNIMRAARRYGLECHGYRKEPEALRTIETPCIIHWNFNHFVVFEGIRGKYAYLNDPAMGRRKLTLEELDDGFTGIVLTFKRTDQFQKEKRKGTLASFVKERLKGQYKVIFKLLYIGLLLVFPGLLLPVFSQFFMDDILASGNTDGFVRFLLFMGGVILFQAVLTFYRNSVLQKLQNKMVLMSTREFVHHLFRLPMGFFDQRYVGDLAGRVDNNANVSVFLAGDLAETVLNIFVAVFYLILLLIYSPLLTLIGVCAVAVNLVIVRLTSKTIADLTMKYQQDGGKLSGAVCAGLNITSTLKASGAENEYISRILGYNAKSVRIEQTLSRTQQIANAVPDALDRIADVVMLMVGSGFVISGSMTVGMLVAFSSLFDSFSEPVNKLVGFIKNIQTLKADMSRVEDIMKYEEDPKFISEEEKEPMATRLEGNVALKDISFGYSRLKPPLVEDFSFQLSSGASIAFIGSSGCGKSTVSKIVSGMYQPWSGEILLDGVPMSKIPEGVLAASVSTVSQNITLFSGTIRDNLTMWNSAVLESDMIAAAKDACIHDIITQKPGAYDYRLSEGGANLSGGQRQRLEIARALATNPSILIMDEATSALDPIVEKKIIDNIKRRGCTCIIVAHRLSAIRDCDQIIVIDQGKIVQQGSHDELSAVDGHYRTFMKNL